MDFFISLQWGVLFAKLTVSQKLFRALIRNPSGRPYKNRYRVSDVGNIKRNRRKMTLNAITISYFCTTKECSFKKRQLCMITCLPEKASAFLRSASYISFSPLSWNILRFMILSCNFFQPVYLLVSRKYIKVSPHAPFFIYAYASYMPLHAIIYFIF